MCNRSICREIEIKVIGLLPGYFYHQIFMSKMSRRRRKHCTKYIISWQMLRKRRVRPPVFLSIRSQKLRLAGRLTTSTGKQLLTDWTGSENLYSLSNLASNRTDVNLRFRWFWCTHINSRTNCCVTVSSTFPANVDFNRQYQAAVGRRHAKCRSKHTPPALNNQPSYTESGHGNAKTIRICLLRNNLLRMWTNEEQGKERGRTDKRTSDGC